MRTLSLLALAVLALGFAPAPFPKESSGRRLQGDLKLLQGDWEVVQHYTGGRDETAQGERIRVSGDRMCWVTMTGEVTLRFRVSLNPQVHPRSMRLVPPKEDGKPWGARYSVDASSLILCIQ